MGEGTALDGPWAGAAAGDGEDIGGCGCGPRRAAASCPEAPVIARRATITKQRIISEKYLSRVTQIKGEYRNRNTKKSGTSGDVCRLSACSRDVRAKHRAGMDHGSRLHAGFISRDSVPGAVPGEGRPDRSSFRCSQCARER